MTGTMATTCSSSLPPVFRRESSPIYKPAAGDFWGKLGRTQLKQTFNYGEVHLKKKIPKLHASSSVKDIVYEDASQGIICYQDDGGDIICEGYDEGPRLEHTPRSTAYNSRDVEIIEILQQSNQSWNQIINDSSDSKYAYKGPKDISCNGF